MVDSQGFQFSEVIAEGTRLRSAAPGTWDHVPPFRVFNARSASSGTGIDNSSTAQHRQINAFAIGSRNRDRCHGSAYQMAGPTVINGRGERRPIRGVHGGFHFTLFWRSHSPVSGNVRSPFRPTSTGFGELGGAMITSPRVSIITSSDATPSAPSPTTAAIFVYRQ